MMNRRFHSAWRSIVCTAATLLLFGPHPSSAQTDVTTQHNDNARTGANLSETVLTASNVNGNQFGKLFERIVDDQVYAQPLLVSGLNMPGLGLRNVLFVATVNDTVYAFDADDPARSAPIWKVSYINPAAGIVPVNHDDVGQPCNGGPYLDFTGNIGIVGTPVIDRTTNTMYVVARTKENTRFVQRLHAIDVFTGHERPGSPTLIEASVYGTGDGSDAQNNLAFNPRTHNQRAALLLSNGIVYIAWASHCDQGPFHGWILGYDASTLQRVMVYNDTPNGGLAGIWQSGQGLSADAAGSLYAMTGNGSFDGDTGGSNRGNSFLKVSPAGQLLDWFTPYNWATLSSTDKDLTIQGPLLVPDTNLVIGAGKQGVMYVLDRNNLGRFRAGSDSQIVQSFQVSTSGRMNGSPVYWNSPSNGPVIYAWPAGDPLKAFRLVNGRFQTTPLAQGPVLSPGGMPGGILSLTADANIPGTGILWATMSNAGSPNHATQPGILRAYDASDITKELWNSQQNATRDGLGNFAKFASPTVANGKVYIATFSQKVVVYGLLGSSSVNTAPVVNAGPDQAITLPNAASLSGTATDDGRPIPPGTLTTQWSLVNGPAAVTFSAPSSLHTLVNFTTAGVYTVRLSASDGSIASLDTVTITAGAPITGSPPVGWQTMDVGSVGIPGSATATSSGTFTLQGAGADISGSADAFRFAYYRLPGNGSIVARVATVQNVNIWTKAGVMIRQSLTADSSHASMFVTPGRGVAFQRRQSAGATSLNTSVAGIVAPQWVKLERAGPVVTASVSGDGTTWTPVGQDTIALTGAVWVGLAVTSHDAARLATATIDKVSVIATGALPAGWQTMDVGSVGIPGSATATNGTFTVQGGGADISGSADAFRFAYYQLPGNGTVVARVATVQNVNIWTKAGVMIRQSLAAESSHASMFVTPGRGVAFQRRQSAGATSLNTSVAGLVAPQWVKLERVGPMVTAFVSGNGTTWTPVGQDTIALTGAVWVGLAVTSHDVMRLATATIDKVSVTATGALPTAWQTMDVGSVGIPGSATATNGTYTVKGAGADIWGSADAFRFAYYQLPGDGAVVARVAAVQNDVNVWTKAGVMIRQSLTAGSSHASMFVTPGRGVAFQRRQSDGATSLNTSLAGVAPQWVKLERVGQVITAWVSSDGTTWTTRVGQDTIALKGAVWVGLAVTSHDATRLATATFEAVTVTAAGGLTSVPQGADGVTSVGGRVVAGIVAALLLLLAAASLATTLQPGTRGRSPESQKTVQE
jgi:regulation of enolase protein 1 (concanavalin A-like superfamily)